MKPKIAIFGIGNPYRQDDGIGPVSISKIRQNPKFSTYSLFDVAIDIFEVESILERKSKFDLAIFIDAASSTMYKPGTILFFPLKEMSKKDAQFATTTHGMTIINFLELLSKVRPEILPKKSLFLAIVASDLGFGEGISDTVKNKLDVVEKLIEDIILRKKLPNFIAP